MGRRTLNRNDYFEAGLELLAAGGVAEQTIAKLCERLSITKGSFYHHFTSLGDFRQQLLAYWEANHEAKMDDAEPNVVEWVAPPASSVDAAVRAWGQSDEAAAAAQERVDALRIKVATRDLRAAGVNADRAKGLSTLGLAIQIGVEAAGESWDRKTRKGIVEEFQRAVEAAGGSARPPVKRKA
ncbi:MAG: TetR/AcrR family transcriptional regulator [Acidimicrobiales bacterium]